jgi:hypothetical protein
MMPIHPVEAALRAAGALVKPLSELLVPDA